MPEWDDYDDDDDFEESGVSGDETFPVLTREATITQRGGATERGRPAPKLNPLDDDGLDDSGTSAADVDWLKPTKAEAPSTPAAGPAVVVDSPRTPAIATVSATPRKEAAQTVVPPPNPASELADATPRSKPRPPKDPPTADRTRIPRAGTVRTHKAPRRVDAAADVATPSHASSSREPTMDSGRQPFGRISIVKPKLNRTKEAEQEGNAVVESFASSHPYHRPSVNAADARIQSASSKKMAKMRNKLSERDRQLTEALQEVKTLQGQIRRQDKVLNKMTNEESDLPNALTRKDDEIRVLEEFCRRGRDKLADVSADAKSKDRQIASLTDQKRALEKLTKDKALKSRKTLTKKVETLAAEMEAKDDDIARLEKLVQQAQRLRHRQKKQEIKEAGSIEETVALRREVEVLRETLERERRVNAIRAPGRATKPTLLEGAAESSSNGLSTFLTQTRTPSPRPSKSPVARLSRSPSPRPMRSPSPAKKSQPQLTAQSATSTPAAKSPTPGVTVDDSAVETAAADAAAADRAAEEAEVERVRKEQAERELEEQRKKDAAAAAEAAAQRAAEERQKAEEDAKVQRELEAERAAAAVEAQRKADLLKKLAALDEGKSVTPAAPPAPTFEAMPVPELATTTQPTKLAQTPAAVEAPQEEVAPPAHAAPAIEAADPVPGWLVQQAKASPKTDRKVLDLQSSFDDSASIGSTSSRRSRRELPQASRESDNLHRGFPASGPLAVVADSESRVSSGRSQHSMTSMTSKLGADNKFVMPGISSSATAAAPSPRTSEKSKLQEGGALPGIGTTAAGSVAKPLTRSRGRLGGPSRGGSKGGGGFHGPKRKKAAMPWDKAKQDSGNSGAGPTAAITSDGLEELETIAI